MEKSSEATCDAVTLIEANGFGAWSALCSQRLLPLAGLSCWAPFAPAAPP